jgi:hypothetical protein
MPIINTAKIIKYLSKMKRKLAVIVLFVYSMVTCKAMAQTVALDYYFNHEVHTTKAGQAKALPLPVGGYRQFRLLGMGRYLQITGRFT